MEKRHYAKPTTDVMHISTVSIIAGSGDPVTAIGGGTFNPLITGGNSGARTRSRRDAWDNGWE